MWNCFPLEAFRAVPFSLVIVTFDILPRVQLCSGGGSDSISYSFLICSLVLLIAFAACSVCYLYIIS